MTERIRSNTGLHDYAAEALALARQGNFILSTAESCTGGLIMAALTDIPGSSSVVDRGFVTYTNKAKMQVLEVNADSIRTHGAASKEVAGEMALGGLKKSSAHLCIAVTGIAGPDGGSDEKPVGSVCFGLAYQTPNSNDPVLITKAEIFENNGRAAIRTATCEYAFTLIISALSDLNKH